MISYLEQLKTHAEKRGLFLSEAFKEADVDATTYSRTIRNKTSMRWKTALSVYAAIERVANKRRRALMPTRRLKIVREADEEA